MYLFTPPYAIVAHIISAGVAPLHCALAPHSPRLISPRFLFSSTCEIPPSEKCSRECHAFSSDGVHSHLAFSASRSAAPPTNPGLPIGRPKQVHLFRFLRPPRAYNSLRTFAGPSAMHAPSFLSLFSSQIPARSSSIRPEVEKNHVDFRCSGSSISSLILKRV